MEHFQIDEYLRLESIKMSMGSIIFETINSERPFLRKWLPFVELTKNQSDTEQFIKSIIRQNRSRRDEIYTIWYKEEFAGLIGFKETDWINRKTELGYWISEKMQGKGIVTKAVNELLRFSFQKLKMNRVQIKVAVGNERSAKIPKRLGFQFEGIEREGEFHSNKYFDLKVFSKLKKEYGSM